jgi:hypothetical protein
VKDILQEHGPDEFDDQNPYSWMKSLENILLPSHRPPRRPSGISQVTMVARNHHRGGNPSGPTLSKVIKKLAVQISDRPENRKFVVEKLTEAHKFIEERQDKVAEKLLAWRDRQIGRWKKVLDERDLAETPNGASIQATAASSSRIEEEQRQQQAGGSTAEEG